MSSLARALAILDLFTPEHPLWTPDELNGALRYSRATGYRYVKELVAAGLLQQAGEGRYALGARIIELDWQLRLTDPVLHVAAPVLEMLAEHSGLDAVLTSMFGGERIVDTHRVAGRGGLAQPYGRGRPRPLFRGAAAKVLVASLPASAQKRLHERHAEEIGSDWPAFRTLLTRIREAGLYVSLGEVDKAVGAAAVPVRNAEGQVVAAIGLVGRLRELKAVGTPTLKRWLDDAAEEIRRGLSR